MRARWTRHEAPVYSGCTFSSAHPQTESRKSVRMVGIRYKTENERMKGLQERPNDGFAATICEGRDVIIASQKKLAETSMMLFSQHPASILPASSSLRRCIETTQGSYRLKALICSIDTDHDDGSPANHVHPSRICTTIRDRLK